MMDGLESVGKSMSTIGAYLVLAQLFDLKTDMMMGIIFFVLGIVTAAIGIMGKGRK